MKSSRKRGSAKPDVTLSPRSPGAAPRPASEPFVVRGSTVETPEGFKLRF